MKTIPGYDVKIFTDNIEETAIEQIHNLLSINVFSQSKIRIMPDVHAGAGCVIGFTGDLGQRVIPNIVGVDIGCGMRVQPFETAKDIDYHLFHEYILNHIPSGRNIRDNQAATLHPKYMDIYREAKSLILQLRCYRELKETKRLTKSIGTLGGGNHFIELEKDENGLTYLVVHTGSRNLGKQVADIYQKLAAKNMSGWDELIKVQNQMIEQYKAEGRKSELKEAIAKLHSSFKMRRPSIPEALCYLENQSREDYLFDMRLCQKWAILNRQLICNILIDYLDKSGYIEKEFDSFESVHNYIGDDNIIRKGAISAREGQKCIIPLNMRDGSLICTGKGNEDWNFSAPHGAGRIMSRARAFKELSLSDFVDSMKGIYSESLSVQTIDEAPMVYKPAEEIIANISGTVAIDNIIKPVFNFKAAE